MFIAALFVKAKRWKQPRCPSDDEWINKMWSVCTMRYYLAIKRKEVTIHATTWMNLENIISGRSQSQKIIYYMIPFIFKSIIGISIMKVDL